MTDVTLHDEGVSPNAESALVAVDDLVVDFAVRGVARRGSRARVRAVDGVSFRIEPGQTLGLVGESGCGKTTTGQALLGLRPVTSGSVRFRGRELLGSPESVMRAARRQMQIVFQDPYSSLNPRWKIQEIIAEPLRLHRLGDRRERRRRVTECMELVGLSPALASRYPHEFSGGQRQRIGIARALAMNPEFLVLDEPMSALDVSTQAEIVNLLRDLQVELSLAYLFIAHDLALVSAMCDRVAVMYLGRIVECGDRDQVFDHALHPYTQALLSAVPQEVRADRPAQERIVLSGDVPSPDAIPGGCRFRSRCWRAQPECAVQDPQLADRGGDGHANACLFPRER